MATVHVGANADPHPSIIFVPPEAPPPRSPGTVSGTVTARWTVVSTKASYRLESGPGRGRGRTEVFGWLDEAPVVFGPTVTSPRR